MFAIQLLIAKTLLKTKLMVPSRAKGWGVYNIPVGGMGCSPLTNYPKLSCLILLNSKIATTQSKRDNVFCTQLGLVRNPLDFPWRPISD